MGAASRARHARASSSCMRTCANARRREDTRQGRQGEGGLQSGGGRAAIRGREGCKKARWARL
eukprot:4405739-Prymnesium_polylepis.1